MVVGSEPLPVPQTPHEQHVFARYTRAQTETKWYLEEHKLDELFSAMLNRLIQRKPRNPETEMIRYLAERIDQKELQRLGIHVSGILQYKTTQEIEEEERERFSQLFADTYWEKHIVPCIKTYQTLGPLYEEAMNDMLKVVEIQQSMIGIIPIESSSPEEPTPLPSLLIWLVHEMFHEDPAVLVKRLEFVSDYAGSILYCTAPEADRNLGMILFLKYSVLAMNNEYRDEYGRHEEKITEENNAAIAWLVDRCIGLYQTDKEGRTLMDYMHPELAVDEGSEQGSDQDISDQGQKKEKDGNNKSYHVVHWNTFIADITQDKISAMDMGDLAKQVLHMNFGEEDVVERLNWCAEKGFDLSAFSQPDKLNLSQCLIREGLSEYHAAVVWLYYEGYCNG